MLTMTPCYSVVLCTLAVVLIAIMTAPLLYLILQKTWETIDAAYVKIKKNHRK